MSNKDEDIDIKIQTYYFFNDIISTKSFDPNNIKIDLKSYKNILSHYIGYVIIRDSKYVKFYSVNPLYLCKSIYIHEVNGYFEKNVKVNN